MPTLIYPGGCTKRECEKERLATRITRLWHPSKRMAKNSPEMKARILGLLEAGYSIREVSVGIRLADQNSMARARVNTNTASSNRVWEEIKQFYGGRCAYCGTKTNDLTKDHVQAIARGGSDTMGNIVPACKKCNSSKRDKHLFDWTNFHKLQLHLLLSPMEI